jgi:hypothetical protein
MERNDKSPMRRVADIVTVVLFVAAIALTIPLGGLIAYWLGWLDGPNR